MFMYRVKLNEDSSVEKGFVTGDKYSDAMERLTEYYGDLEIAEVTVVALDVCEGLLVMDNHIVEEIHQFFR